MNLNPDDPKLTAYALGELPESDRAAVEPALRQSPECRQALGDIRGMGALLETALAAEPCPQFERERQKAVIEAARRPVPAREGGESWFSWLRWNPLPVLAGAAALLAALVLIFQRIPPPAPAVAGPEAGTNPVPGEVTSEEPLPTPVGAPQGLAATRGTPVLPEPPPRPVAVVPVVKPPPAPGVPVIPPLEQPPAPAVALALAPLPIQLPMPSFKGTPDDLPKGPHIEPFSDKPRPPFLAPAGVKNVALNKKVTSSDKSPITGSYSQLTDGNKDAIDDAVVEMHKNVQWVQMDLEKDHNLYALLIWHDHRYVQVFRCVVVQVADDPDFTRNVQTLFNNDLENLAGLGIGKDLQYFETNQGKLIDAKGIKGRHLRFYSKGSNASALNCYTEIEVYGLPAQ